MQKEVMIKKPMRDGESRLVKAVVLSERNGVLRCVDPNASIKKPFEVNADDVIDSGKVFSGNRLQQQRGAVVPQQFPGHHSLSRIMEARVAPPRKSARSQMPSKLMHEKGVVLKSDDETKSGSPFHVGQKIRHKESGWQGKVHTVYPPGRGGGNMLRVAYQSSKDTKPMLVNHHSNECEAA